MTQKMKPARRILDLPPYLFKEIDDKKRAVLAQGRPLINLGIGDPDLPTPSFVVEAMAREIRRTENQKYPAYEGSAAFRKAVAGYMRERFGVEADPDREVMALIGSKEGIAHFAWGFVDPGDISLVPDPGYPVYRITTELSGGTAYMLPMEERSGFFPDLSEIPESVLKKAKILYLNYPNNPTGAVADRERLAETVVWAKKHGLIIVSDAAYAEIVYDPGDRFSLLSLPGARDVVIEFHSFSKTFNMTGWRIGFAVGNQTLISGLLKIKTNLDSGVFDAIQLASAAGLSRLPSFLDGLVAEYKIRKEALTEILSIHGWKFFPPAGAFYVWAECPKGIASKDWTMRLIGQTGIVTTPGSGFGNAGEGYVRFSLTQPVQVIRRVDEALSKILVKV